MLLALLLLLQDATPQADALKKLSEAKSYSFVLDTAVEKNRQVILGGVEKALLVAEIEKGARMARHGPRALFLSDSVWRTISDAAFERRVRHQEPTNDLERLAIVRAPHEEFAAAVAAVKDFKEQRYFEEVNGTDCVAWSGTVPADIALALAKAGVASDPPRVTSTEAPGATPDPWKAAEVPKTSTPDVKDAKGKLKFCVRDSDGVPMRLAYVITARVDRVTRTFTRVVTLAEIGTAKLDVPDEVKKRLGIK